MPGDRHVERRVGNHRLGELAPQQHRVRGALQGVAADQAVPAQLPAIAQLADGRALRDQPRQIVGRVGRRRCRLAIQQQVDLSRCEAGQFDVEVDLDQRIEVVLQQFEVPNRLFRQAVVADHHCLFLSGAEADDCQRRDLGQPEALGRFQAGVAGKDGAGLVDQDRVGPNSRNIPHQAGNLRLRMAPRVVREGLQVADRAPDDLFRQPPRW